VRSNAIRRSHPDERATRSARYRSTGHTQLPAAAQRIAGPRGADTAFSTTTSGESLVVRTTRSQAEHALMDALEQWAKSLGEHGVTKENGARYLPVAPDHADAPRA
jgi:hypothetical protein